MRTAWAIVVGAILGAVGCVVWAVGLAVYQQLMEPSGSWVDPNNGHSYAHLAENNTYWPREVRHLAILLALGAVVAIGRASKRAFIVASVLGVVWLGADTWLDRIDIDGRPAARWLMVAAGIAVATAALVAWRGPAWEKGRAGAAGAAAVLALMSMGITSPWREPLTAPWREPLTASDQIAINNAITVMDMVLACGLLVVAVTIVAPAITTARSWLLVLAGTASTLAGVLYSIAHRAEPGDSLVPLLMLWVLPLMAVAAAHGGPIRRLLLVGGVTVVVAPCVLGLLTTLGAGAGTLFTSLAANPPINTDDGDFTLALPLAAIGFGLGVLNWAVAGRPTQPVQPQPVEPQPSEPLTVST
jgi:hypothetical protein